MTRRLHTKCFKMIVSFLVYVMQNRIGTDDIFFIRTTSQLPSNLEEEPYLETLRKTSGIDGMQNRYCVEG